MMSCSFLFITAKNADVKLVNRLLLTLRDWEFGDESTWDNFALVTSKTDTLPVDLEPTQPPLQEFPQNEWEGATIEEIETTILATDREKQPAHGKVYRPNNLSLFLVLDDRGVTDGTVILFKRATDWDAEPISYPERFNKRRTPWTNAYLDWCNLDIANMEFSEMCDCSGADKGKSEADGVWWTYLNAVGELTSDETKKRRDAVIKELEGLGLA
ncbi:hypothetical protein CI238_04070 [Colletotrichum incanum]|uniref:Uncharacterized protein n=1 Tax=Colletotrichum incanum TaxID=1573173 RepID=A0A167ED96_COLIC|nr:hypothetical protein CI238_04070 [Colletotrichum incanum]